MDREQIIKSLECCDGTLGGCERCPNYKNRYRCSLKPDALSLIKELTAEVEARKAQHEKFVADIEKQLVELAKNNERLQCHINRLKKYDEERDIALHARLIAEAKADTVRKLQERLKSKLNDCCRYIWNNREYFIVGEELIDQIAKEMIDDDH